MKRSIIIPLIITLLLCIALATFYILPEIRSFSPYGEVTMEAKITAGDKLAFWGTIISSLLTIEIVVFSYLLTQKNAKEERRLAISPYIVSSCTICEDYAACEEAVQGENKTYYITRPAYATLLTKNICDSIYSYDLLSEIKKDEADFFKHNLVLDYNLINYGAGNAVNFNAYLNKDRLSYPNSTVPIGSKVSFVIVLNDEIFHSEFARNDSEAIVDVNFTYSDINRFGYYEQHERLFVHLDKYNNKITTSQLIPDVLTSAKLLKKAPR